MKKLFTLLLLAAMFTSEVFAQNEYENLDRQSRIELSRQELLASRWNVSLGTAIVPFFTGWAFNGSDVKNLLPINVEVGYRVWEFFEVSLYFNHTPNSYNVDSYTSSEPYVENSYHCSNHALAFGVNIRYSWFNRNGIQMYSSLGGAAVTMITTTTESGKPSETTSEPAAMLPDFTPFGVRFGKKFYGYVEPFSVSARGLFILMGAGIRF